MSHRFRPKSWHHKECCRYFSQIAQPLLGVGEANDDHIMVEQVRSNPRDARPFARRARTDEGKRTHPHRMAECGGLNGADAVPLHYNGNAIDLRRYRSATMDYLHLQPQLKPVPSHGGWSASQARRRRHAMNITHRLRRAFAGQFVRHCSRSSRAVAERGGRSGTACHALRALEPIASATATALRS